MRGEIPVTLPPNTTGNEAYTSCFYAFNLNGLVAGRQRRSSWSSSAPKHGRKLLGWNEPGIESRFCRSASSGWDT